MSHEILKKHYYDIRSGFSSLDKFYRKLIKLGINVSREDVDNFLKKQEAFQLSKKITKPRAFNSIFASEPWESTQLDIMIYDRYEFHKYKYILNFIDVHSRFVVSKALTNRKIDNIINILEDIFKKYKIPKNINLDNEFNNNLFNNFANKHNIKLHFSQPNELYKNAIVERFNYTLALLLQKIRQSTGRYDWYNWLDDAVENYNNTYHKTIKATPHDVLNNLDTNKQEHTYIKHDFKVNDRVRLLVHKKPFAKGDQLRFSKQIYEISNIDGNKIYVKDDNKIKDRWYRPYELLKIIDVQKNDPSEDNNQLIEHEKTQNIKKITRQQNKEGLHQVNKDTGDYIIHRSLKPLNEKRERKQPTRFS